MEQFINDIITVFFENNYNLLDEYKKRNMLDGKNIVVKQGNESEYTACVVGVDESFGVSVSLSDGTEKTLRSGEELP